MGCLFMMTGCSRFLDQSPQGAIASEDLNTPENVEKMVIAAYASLTNETKFSPQTLWYWGSLRSGDAYKGGDGVGDYGILNDYETFVTNRPDNYVSDDKWVNSYDAISRINDALRRVNEMDESTFPQKKVRQGELRFLRGHFYFNLKVLFKYIPYIDESVPKEVYDTISNRQYSNDGLWTKIAEDFRFAADNLPTAPQQDAGRPYSYTAKAYLAKTLLYQAYTQDENNQVTAINHAKLEEVNTLCNDVIGKYSLFDDFGKNFLTAYENGVESIFSVQYSYNDGTGPGRLDWAHALDWPMSKEYGCCGFHVPSQNMINAFKTDNDGLPLFDTFNNTDAVAGDDFLKQSFDPRLDHSVAIPGHPFKYKTDLIYDATWARAANIYGASVSMKEMVAPDDPSYRQNPPDIASAKNWEIIRYADVLLWKAEALIELGRQDEALPLINQLRTRAAHSTGMLKLANGNYMSNYKVGTYQPGVNCTWTQEYARQALRWERRLELAFEDYRFFDLVRWGIAATYLNNYFREESKKRSYLSTAVFKKERDEYLPVPLNQINYSKGLYKQNTGW